MKYIKEETKFIGKYSNHSFQSILMSIEPFKGKLIKIVLIGFLGRALLLGNTNIIGKWADTLCIKSQYCQHSVGVFKNFNNHNFLWLLLGMSTVGMGCLMLFRITISRLGTYSASRLFDETTMRVARFPIEFFDTNPVGRIITRFTTDYYSLFRMAGGPLGEFLSITFDLILFFILIIVASYYYIPLILFSILLNYFVYKLNHKKIRKLRRESSSSRGPVISHFSETTIGSKIIRAYGKQEKFYNYFTKKLEDNLNLQQKTNTLINIFSLQMSFLNIMLLFITAVVGLWLIKMGLSSLGSLGVAFIFIAMVSSTIQVFFEWVSSVEDALTGTERMAEYLFKPLELGVSLPNKTNFHTGHPVESHDALISSSKHLNEQRISSSYALEVIHLSLRYQEKGPRILNDITFKIRHGEKIGIVGKTGSGKSSLIQALFHLYPFESGQIIINGHQANLDAFSFASDPHIVSLENFRKNIFLLTQDPVLYTGTLRENITTNFELSDENILFVSKLLGLDKMILSHPNKLNRMIEEKGANLSSGERQLICMARCLLQEAPLILMDEATSAIDPQTEHILLHAIQKFLRDRTQIIVAHRLSTIENCDRILWLENGRIIMEDTPRIVLPYFEKSKKG